MGITPIFSLFHSLFLAYYISLCSNDLDLFLQVFIKYPPLLYGSCFMLKKRINRRTPDKLVDFGKRNFLEPPFAPGRKGVNVKLNTLPEGNGKAGRKNPPYPLKNGLKRMRYPENDFGFINDFSTDCPINHPRKDFRLQPGNSKAAGG